MTNRIAGSRASFTDSDDDSDHTSNVTSRNAKGQLVKNKTMSLSFNGLDWTITKDTMAEDIVRRIEMLVPLTLPIGCGPVACVDWFKVGNSELTVGMRDEILMNKMGWTVGDRTFKRCYLRAYHEIKRYNRLSPAQRKACDDEKMKGIEDPDKTFNQRNYLDDKGGNKRPQPRIRSPYYAIQKAFQNVVDKHWHRHMFPFGCYFIDRGSATEPSSEGWKEWMSDMKSPAAKNYIINPNSVTSADILYLCNTVGYLERLIYAAVIIWWAKGHGVNLLIHGKGRKTEGYSAFEQFVSLEKHFFMFGCLNNHRQVLTENKLFVGGNWANEIEALTKIEKKLHLSFNLQPGELKNDLERFMVRSIRGNLSQLSQTFLRSGMISESKTN